MDNCGELLACLRGELTARVPGYFPELSRRFRLDVLHHGRPLLRKHSVLFEFSVVDQGQDLSRGIFVKIPKGASATAVQTIYDTLASLYEMATQLPEELNVVRPLDVFPDLRAIVTARVEGQDLARLLCQGRRVPEPHDLLRHCGRFLRAYHEQLGRITWEGEWQTKFLHSCATHLQRLGDHGIGEEQRRQLLAAFERSAGHLESDVPVCVTSDDYSVHNIIVQGSRIFVIEATAPRIKAVYEDLAAFLNSLTALFWGTPRFFLGGVPPARFGQQFLAGYFPDATPLPALSLFCAKGLCFRWWRALDTLSHRTQGVAGALCYLPVRRCINRFFSGHVLAHLQHAEG